MKKRKGDFALTIDFDRNAENPERVFAAMAEMISALKTIDKSLIHSIDNNIKPVLMLEDVESGSMIVWLKQLIEQVDDDALKNIDWKPLIGQYLVKAKHVVVDFLEGKTKITDASEIKELQQKLFALAEETDVKKFPAYTPVSIPSLINNLDKLNKSLKKLDKNDKVFFKSTQGDGTFNLDFDFNAEEIQDLLTKEELSNTATLILKVKKPDYLGTSQWEFKYDKRNISVKILDQDWLKLFQQRKKDVRPGDSIKADVLINVKYGYDMNVISTIYEIIKVHKIIADENISPALFEPTDH